MAVVNTKSVQVTNSDATPPTINANKLANCRVKRAIGMVEAVNGDSIGSTYRCVRVHSSWGIDRLLLSCDAVTTCAGDIGVYDTLENGGAVIDADFFASAQSLAAALVNSDVTHEADPADAGAGYGLADVEKSLYDALGLTAHKWLDIVVTLTAAAASAGTVALKAHYVDGN